MAMLDDKQRVVRLGSDTDHIETLIRLETEVAQLKLLVNTVVVKMDLEHDLHHEYIKKALEREARKEKLHQAIIEKTISSLVWSTLVGIALLVWSSLKDHLK